MRACMSWSWPSPPMSWSIEVEARRVAQLGDRGRRDDVDRGLLDARQGHHRPAGDGLGAQPGAAAQVPVLELDVREGLALAAAGHAETRHAAERVHGLLLVLLEVAPHLVDDGLRLLERRADGQRHHRHQHPLVLVGEVAGGHAHEEHGQQDDDHDEHDAVARLAREHVLHGARVAVAAAVEEAIEPEEERAQEADSRSPRPRDPSRRAGGTWRTGRASGSGRPGPRAASRR